MVKQSNDEGAMGDRATEGVLHMTQLLSTQIRQQIEAWCEGRGRGAHADLAREAKMPRATLSRFLSGKDISTINLAKLERFLRSVQNHSGVASVSTDLSPATRQRVELFRGLSPQEQPLELARFVASMVSTPPCQMYIDSLMQRLASLRDTAGWADGIANEGDASILVDAIESIARDAHNLARVFEAAAVTVRALERGAGQHEG